MTLNIVPKKSISVQNGPNSKVSVFLESAKRVEFIPAPFAGFRFFTEKIDIGSRKNSAIVRDVFVSIQNTRRHK